MSEELAILMGTFIAVGTGIFATSQFAETTLHQYRAYFVHRIGPDLRRSFIVADLTLLFASTLALIGVLAMSGYVLIGWTGAAVGFVVGVATPKFALQMIKKRRAERFILQLPDALHSLSSTLRSGTNLPKGMEQLAQWQPKPLSQEFSLVLTEYQIGRELGEALDNMQDRIQRPEVDLMNGAIKISRSVGGNLADTLESLAETLSEKITIEGKIHALTAMGRLQGWVVSAVPVFMGVAMYFTNPDQILPLFTEFRGWVTLGVISIMMVLAVISIRRIVDIDV